MNEATNELHASLRERAVTDPVFQIEVRDLVPGEQGTNRTPTRLPFLFRLW